MKYYLIIEDSEQGIRAAGAQVENGVTDSMELSLAAKVIANFSNSLADLNMRGLLNIEQMDDDFLTDSTP